MDLDLASHELQEPLRVITSYLQLLERRCGDKLGAEGLEFVHCALDGATRMQVLVEDLLRLSRAGIQITTFVPVSARALVDAAVQNLDVAAAVSVDPLPQVVADPALLTLVFQNLIGNAVKFHAPEVQPRVHVSSSSQNGDCVFSVSDNGLGIESRHHERIFGVFERLHSADEYPGSGVGLAISQRIVERHGGRIWVESKPGEGSTFRFSIPVPLDCGVFAAPADL